IIDRVVPPNQDPGPPLGTILNVFNPVATGQLHSAVAVIVFLGIIYIILAAIGAALSYAQQFLATFLAQTVSARLRKTLFDQLQRLSLDWHGRQKKGDLVQRITGDIGSIEKLITDGLVDLFTGGLTLVLSVYVLVNTQFQLTLISVVVLPALFVIILIYTRGIKAAAKRAAKAVGEVAEVATEDVGAITVLKAFSLEDREATRFNRYVGKSQVAGMEAGRLQAQFTPVVDVLVAVGTAVIIGAGGMALATGSFPLLGKAIPAVTVGTLTLFISYLKQLYQPMRDLSKLTNVATSAIAGAERIQEVLDQAPEVTESLVPYTGPQRLKGEITFDNVVFGYTPERPILKGINLHIPAGKKVALVGLSGGGKTTLIKLIPRFYEVQQGSVKIDGGDNRFYPLSVLRRNVSQVLQESVLFEGSILDNLKIGRPEASMEEVKKAAQQAQIHETIMSMPDGYNTKVRERGKNFSGGQRQRMAIARAILTDSPILILDEPTASLDVEAEAEVLRAIDTLVEGRTVLMISHRLSTLGNVDEIIVLKDGQIVEQGSYQALKRQGGVFADLLKEQNRYNVDYQGKSIIVPQAELIKLGLDPQIISPKPARIGAGNGVKERAPGESRRPRGVPGKAHLVVEVDGRIVGEHQLATKKRVLTVGRLPENDISISSHRISRLHAKLIFVDGKWQIEDAESLNGLKYRGERVSDHFLENGDQITLAPDVILSYKEVV
ncbi:MAG: ATP-binding cassette domain-containing protein, partial [Chloroflexi bacterium]|nr:ATP-binding cassette domain-containing protein [Chloroflexota bacterium]